MDIDVSKLEKEMIVKNYKAMCELLNEEHKTGKSKISQINHWKRFFDFDKQGHKFVIKDIYEKPLPLVDARKVKEGVYIGYIESLLMDKIQNELPTRLTISKSKLYEMLGMVSSRYFTYRSEYDEIVEGARTETGITITKDDIQHFYNRSAIKLNSILTTALESMQRRHLIEVNLEYVICYDEYSYDKYYGEFSYDSPKQAFRIARGDETEQIYEIEKEVMKRLECENFAQIIMQDKATKHSFEIDKRLKEEFGWNYVYKQLNIVYLNNDGLRINSKKINKMSREAKMLALNKEIIKALNVQAQAEYNKTLVDEPELKLSYKYDINFTEIQRQLSDYLIGLDTGKEIK